MAAGSQVNVGELVDLAHGRVTVDDLMRDLVHSVRMLLEADTASVLLIEASGRFLESTASDGIELAVRRRVRVPIGAGFAGRIAQTRQPRQVLVSPETVYNPVILNSSVRSLLGAPLIWRDQILGVVHVGSLDERTWTPTDEARLVDAASHLAEAAADRRAGEDRAAAIALQRSLVPQTLPQIDGVDLAARYLPADGLLGGDWYDVLDLPSGIVGWVMGDVAGHGLGAAVVMGRLRSALRAYALEHDDPADVVHRLDRKIRHFEPGAFATLVYAVARPPYDTVQVTLAGHPAPVLVDANGDAAQLQLAPDLPLGVDPEMPRHTVTVRIPPGGSLALFTDGLVERRGGASVAMGVQRVADALLTGDADTCCTNVISALIGSDPIADDVALLVIRPT